MVTQITTSLTPARRKVLRFIKQYIRKNGYPPMRREIADGCGYKSSNSVEETLRRLTRDGYVRLDDRGDRNIVVIK